MAYYREKQAQKQEQKHKHMMKLVKEQNGLDM
jgi:hypothetical protein